MKFKGVEIPLDKSPYTNCPKCKDLEKRGGWSWIDLGIMHDNGHVWPGFAGEPDGGNYGGSDF